MRDSDYGNTLAQLSRITNISNNQQRAQKKQKISRSLFQDDYRALKNKELKQLLSKNRPINSQFKSTNFKESKMIDMWRIKPIVQIPEIKWQDCQIRNVTKDRYSNKLNQKHPKTDAYRRKNVTLTPLGSDALEIRTEKRFSKIKAIKHNVLEKIELKVSRSIRNIYTKFYEVNSNGITKLTGDKTWHPLFCQSLPQSGNIYFTFTIVYSKFNEIVIGILPQNSKMMENLSIAKAVSMNIGKGLIQDSKINIEQDSTSWRSGGKPIKFDKNSEIKVVLDLDEQYIDWYCDSEVIGSARITNHLKKNGIRPFVCIYDVNDVVIVNDTDAVKQQSKQERIDESKESDLSVQEMILVSDQRQNAEQGMQLVSDHQEKEEANPEAVHNSENKSLKLSFEQELSTVYYPRVIIEREKNQYFQKNILKESRIIQKPPTFHQISGIKWQALYKDYFFKMNPLEELPKNHNQQQIQNLSEQKESASSIKESIRLQEKYNFDILWEASYDQTTFRLQRICKSNEKDFNFT